MIDTNISLTKYEKILESVSALPGRMEQAKTLSLILEKYFNFDKIECIETGASQNFSDGCFGLYLCDLVDSTNGVFHSVDINENLIKNSKTLFEKYYPNTNINHYVSDSVTFLKNYDGNPNLVHLDSKDLDLINPIPSMLHGWLEFEAIKDKMPSGSICIIDDNFMKGTWVDWMVYWHGELTESKAIYIDYEIIGKGSLIYHWCNEYNTDWEIIGDHYHAGPNIKIIIRKK